MSTFLYGGKTVKWCKVDVDKANDVSQACGIRSMPTFLIYKKEQAAK